jgi:riboflavin kinase/FMN adenylyltransferase
MTFGVREKFGAIEWRGDIPSSVRGSVVSVGNFDGVHRGHAELIRQAGKLATEISCGVTILTFDPHPLQLLAPERFQPQLTTLEDRIDLLLSNGATAVVVIRTDRDLLNLTPEDFFRHILNERLDAKGVVEGFNFRFGHDRAGSVDTMRDLCASHGLPFRIVEPLMLDDVVVSSSRVRDALITGDVRAAARWLDRPYAIRGTVIKGAKRGRTIGFPTANLGSVQTILPGEGVYAVQVRIGEPNRISDRVIAGAANIGPNPTFGESARKIEIHLIGFTGDLYGRSLLVEFMERLRGTRKFNSVEELVAQMRLDVERARTISM